MERVAKWSDILTLIAVAVPTEETDDSGFYAEPTETKREVFANRKSVGYSEFYKSDLAGYSTELKFDVHSQEYAGEPFAEYGGKRYKILRTYDTKNGEFTELTLSDLSERAHTTEAPEGGAGGDAEPEGGGAGGEV